MSSIVEILIGPITALLDKIIPDKDERERLAHEIAVLAAKQAHEAAQAQIEVNKQEAAHHSLFVAGWRPAVGWTCVLGMAGNFIIIPTGNFVLALLQKNIVVPLIDLETMLPVLMGMLGLGVMRSYEKVNGVARKK